MSCRTPFEWLFALLDCPFATTVLAWTGMCRFVSSCTSGCWAQGQKQGLSKFGLLLLLVEYCTATQCRNIAIVHARKIKAVLPYVNLCIWKMRYTLLVRQIRVQWLGQWTCTGHLPRSCTNSVRDVEIRPWPDDMDLIFYLAQLVSSAILPDFHRGLVGRVMPKRRGKSFIGYSISWYHSCVVWALNKDTVTVWTRVAEPNEPPWLI
jgi:hypothetical protein